MQPKRLHDRLIVKVGDITTEDADAIVNAANSSLQGGSGVDGAVHRAGGPAILEECEALRRTRYPKGLPPGEAVITTAGRLPALHVIHTVGPIYGKAGGNEMLLLASCYINSIGLARQSACESIAFPSISTGAYGYPKDEAARIVSRVLAPELKLKPALEIRLVFFTDADAQEFLAHQTIGKA